MSKHDFYVVDGCVDFVPVKRSTLTPNGVEVTIVGSAQKERVLVDRVYQMAKIFEPQKPVIPQFVAEWIEYCRSVGHDFLRAISAGNAQANKVDCWIYSNQETFTRAWFDGYEVEQEKKYRVMLSNKQVLSKDDEFNTVFFVHDTTDLRAEFTRPELEQAGFGWVFDCEGVKVEEVK